MSKRKPDELVGVVGVWGYTARKAIDAELHRRRPDVASRKDLISTNEVGRDIGYDGGTIRRLEGGSIPHGPSEDLVEALAAYYQTRATELGIQISPPPPEYRKSRRPGESPAQSSDLIAAIDRQTQMLVSLVRQSAGEPPEMPTAREAALAAKVRDLERRLAALEAAQRSEEAHRQEWQQGVERRLAAGGLPIASPAPDPRELPTQ